jgi:predicted  nucleic acid-binding Zn-ribbon protein
MDPELFSLVNLQNTLNEQIRLRQRTQAIPDEIRSLQEQQEALERREQEEEEAFHNMEREERRLERELASAEDGLVKKQAGLHEVKTNKEYTAALHEIETLKQKKSELEEQALLLMEQIAGQRDDLKRRTQELDRERKALTDRIQEVTAEGEAAKKRIEELDTLAPECQAKVMPQLLEQFKKLYHSKKGRAVVPIQQDSCSGCQISLSPQIVSAARSGDRIVACDHCGRILYWDGGAPND